MSGLSSRKTTQRPASGRPRGDLSPEESVFCLRGHAQVSILMTRGAAAFSPLFLLGSVPNGADRNPLALHSVENDIGSASDDQLADSGVGSGPAQMRMIS